MKLFLSILFDRKNNKQTLAMYKTKNRGKQSIDNKYAFYLYLHTNYHLEI